ncbi:hypothetical protein C7999DRAFT_33294 [Corynascus novoguineensis]|uniref:Uncharacterized protein n=1 Tax=Corynascus novoguineensis TaxID=1126955 RepID=A0AAN7HE55_9PEZI|nr:hypothetical protein C7999DRAFT_33294 [Corynascus novoguineensis]
MPGVHFPGATLETLYYSVDPGLDGLPDYSGQTNLALKRRWKDLSRSADTVAKIPNLIWTDLAANAVVGTKGLAGMAPNQRVLVTV